MEYTGTCEAPREVLQFNLVSASSCHLSKLTWGISLTCDFVTLVSVGFSHAYIFSHMNFSLIVVSQKNKHAEGISEVLTT